LSYGARRLERELQEYQAHLPPASKMQSVAVPAILLPILPRCRMNLHRWPSTSNGVPCRP
jgi:hypothetical protein